MNSNKTIHCGYKTLILLVILSIVLIALEPFTLKNAQAKSPNFSALPTPPAPSHPSAPDIIPTHLPKSPSKLPIDWQSLINSGVSYVSYTAITSGGEQACGLTSTGGVKCWGGNFSGQLGNGTNFDSYIPLDVTGLTSGVSAITAGYTHTCALVSGGIKCWGSNSSGQLGDGTNTDNNLPVDVSGLTSGVSAITAGKSHTCALTTSGGVKCWGSNSFGQLGNATNIDSSIPMDVSGLTSGVSAISAGGYHTCALTTTNGVKCWGGNSLGQLGQGNDSFTDSNIPVDVKGLPGISAISAGYNHTCAKTSTGGAMCWGDDGVGQLGDGGNTISAIPVNVSGLTSGVLSISAGTLFSCALTSSHGVKCWGSNASGKLGIGSTTNSNIPVDVTGLTSGATAVSAGSWFACALTNSGSIKCWGYNGSGDLGDGTTIDCYVPLIVIDSTSTPTVNRILRASTNPSNAASVDFKVTFSELVTGVVKTDFSLTQTGLTGVSVTNVSGAGAVYTVSASTGAGLGTLRLDLIDDDTILDSGGNPLGGPGLGNGSFTTGEVYSIKTPGADVKIAGVDEGVVYLPLNTFGAKSVASLVTGPVQVTSNLGLPIFTSQRATSGESYNETMGVPTSQLSTDYWFPVYDHSYIKNVNTNPMRMWVLIGNASTTQNAIVNVLIGGVKTTDSPFTILPGGQITPRWMGTRGGPLEVVSTNGVKIFTSERVFTYPTSSFNEILGFPASQITSEYWFPYYDSLSMTNSIQVANTSSSQAATVDIYVGTVKEGSYSIPANSFVTKSYSGVVDGPVRVVSTNGAPVVASQITLSGPNNSFNEVMGYPYNQFTTEYWYPAYDHAFIKNVNTDLMRMWVLVGNPSTTQTATVDIYIAGVKTADSPFSIPAGGRVTPRWMGVTNGPVRVVSTNSVPIFTSERVFTYPNNVFNEMMGFPLNQMASEYWFPYYDSISMNNDILISRP